ncbi:MAG: nucleoside phosphorylase, partial [Thermodesulfobacteriota bacterium]
MSSRNFHFPNSRDNQGIVKPYTKNLKPLPKTGIICAVKKDLEDFKRLLSVKGGGFGFLMSHVFKFPDFFLSGPYFGSPYAAALIETLAQSGAEQIISIGWCGSISDDLSPGDIIIPDKIISDDSTYKSYLNTSDIEVKDSKFSKDIKDFLIKKDIDFKKGSIWTTGALYRETPEKTDYFKSLGCIGVEMENSALYSAADFCGIDI